MPSKPKFFLGKCDEIDISIIRGHNVAIEVINNKLYMVLNPKIVERIWKQYTEL